MNSHKQLQQLLGRDQERWKLGQLQRANRDYDQNHLERRQQQRGIDDAMIAITLLHGKRHFYKGASIYTLTDRCLIRTAYEKFIDSLRGLRVVCLAEPPDPIILTAYWHYTTKRRASRCHHRLDSTSHNEDWDYQWAYG